jgi:hypothetical protein
LIVLCQTASDEKIRKSCYWSFRTLSDYNRMLYWSEEEPKVSDKPAWLILVESGFLKIPPKIPQNNDCCPSRRCQGQPRGRHRIIRPTLRAGVARGCRRIARPSKTVKGIRGCRPFDRPSRTAGVFRGCRPLDRPSRTAKGIRGCRRIDRPILRTGAARGRHRAVRPSRSAGMPPRPLFDCP